ncbi:hypothetical protein B0G93_111100 [Bacillus sp. V-88]|uniref:hypothetical protein n=1 Tax=Rossellomorea vietnamensis TaxID=218284 RepID=UPI0009D017FC|nr:hypothetical protein [Rossellomorea vietnamensis]PRX75966.1 hypothetical protein B0G93_111100 [Bacillus sp. V-88]SLK23332.1 hypothetical protein SAMN06295884_111100 [Bacillus sp. V-88]
MINSIGFLNVTKRKRLYSVIVVASILTILFIWSELRDRMYDLHYTPKASQMTFEFKTPTQVPFAEMKVTGFTVGEDQREAEMSLLNADINMMDIRISSSKPEYEADKIERVKIGHDIYGDFIPDIAGRRVLSWKDDLYYEVTYYPKLTPKEVSKTQLIQMAESFQ